MADNNNKRNVGTKQSTEYIKKLIQQIAIEQGVPVELALAVAQHESGFNNTAVSKKNTDGSRDHGVFQLNDRYHKLNNVYDPEENIRYGIGMLKAGLARNNGNVAKTLSDYNAGPNATGKGRRQGDAYAQRVLSLMPNFDKQQQAMIALSNAQPVKTADQVTGAAAPIGERAENLQKDYTSLADRNILNYASQPYDPSLFQNIRAQRAMEALDLANKMYRETPMTPSQEELNRVQAPFTQVPQNIADMQNRAIEAINARSGVNAYAPYEERLRAAYEDQIARAQAANPYTQMAQIAPVEALEAVDIDQLKRQQAGDRFGSSLNAMLYNSPNRPDYEGMRQRNLEELQKAAAFNRAQQVARQTGLTDAEFIERGLMDRTQQDQALTRQNAQLGQLYLNAMQGDIQAQQIIGSLIQSGQGNLVTNAANQAKAIMDMYNQRRLMQQERANQNKDLLNYIGGVDATALGGANQVQQQNIASAASMANTGMNAGVNAQRNMYGFESNFLPGNATAGEEVITPRQQFKDLVGPMATYYQGSPDPNAMENFYNSVAGGAVRAGYDPSLVQSMYGTNLLNPQQNK